jgi:RNA-directed DNA polymerase
LSARRRRRRGRFVDVVARERRRPLAGSRITRTTVGDDVLIRGWSAYYRGVVSRETFNALDTYMWKLTYKWATYSHPNKSKRWVVSRYFDRFNRSRRARWVLPRASITNNAR